MQNAILITIVCIALAMSVIIGFYALFHGRSDKKNYFLLLQVAVVVYLLGHLLELLSGNTGEAYTAVKVLYVGASFAPLFTFFFIADYCGIKLHPLFVKTPLALISAAEMILMWTTKYHHLVYAEYHFDNSANRFLVFSPGALYSVLHTYTVLCLLAAMALIISQYKNRQNKYRKSLLIVLVCLVVPFVAEAFYYITIITGLNTFHIYFTPHSIALMSVCMYGVIMHYNIFDIIPAATLDAMEHINEGLIIVDNENNYLSSNIAAKAIIPGLAVLRVGESVRAASGWPPELGNLDNNTVDFSLTVDETRYFKSTMSMVTNAKGQALAKSILLLDITSTVALVKDLENAAYNDALTGLYNRRHFLELALMSVGRSLRLGKQVFMVMLDLDFFKNVNDAYGHAAGDMVLRISAGILKKTVRAYDLVGRYGGEEFTLLLTDSDLYGARLLLERIRKNIAKSAIKYENSTIKITCSIGFAQISNDITIEQSIKNADDAMYAAKNAGRNQVKYYS
jgi:diguanylate cyclase (GGDEF)-like protein